MTKNIYCEVDGKPGDRYDDPYYPGEGYTVDMCPACIRLQRRQAEIDAQVERDDEAYRAAADAEWQLAG